MYTRPPTPFTVFPMDTVSGAGLDLSSIPVGTELHFEEAGGANHVVLPSVQVTLGLPAAFRDLPRERDRVEREAMIAAGPGRSFSPQPVNAPSAGASSGAQNDKNARRPSHEEILGAAARRIAAEAQRKDRPSNDSLFKLAVAQRLLGDLPASERSFLDLLGREGLDDRHRARVLAGLGVTLREAGRLPESLARIEQALRLKFTNPHYHCEKGITLKALGKTRAAEKSIKWAIELNPKLARFHCELALVYASLRLLEQAQDAIDRAILLDPDHPRHYCEEGIILRQKGRYAAALASHRKAIGLDPSHPRHHAEMALTLEASKQHFPK